MLQEFITIEGRQYRVEANWNALVAYLEATGRDTMDALSLFGQLRPSDIAPLMAACIAEGERLEGRESDLTAQRIGEVCGFDKLTEFLQIYARQTNPQKAPEESKKD